MTQCQLQGKTVFITGAAKRLGAETARTLHAAGANIVVHYRGSAAEAVALQQSLNQLRPHSCYLIQGDLLDTAQLPGMIEQVIADTGRLDVLINNASAFYPTPVGEITEQHWNELMGSNLKAPLFLIQAAAPYLRETQGCIVNMIDVHGMRPLPDYAVYGAAKAGLLMLTQLMARDLGPTVRVNGVAPGAILWPEDQANSAEQDKAGILQRTALQREGTPQDIAKAILYLVRDAPYVTGHILPVDGGRLLNH